MFKTCFFVGKTYFFKGKGFWKFNDLRMRVENERQTLSAPFWMGCSKNIEDGSNEAGNKAPYTVAASSNRIPYYTSFLVVILAAINTTALRFVMPFT